MLVTFSALAADVVPAKIVSKGDGRNRNECVALHAEPTCAHASSASKAAASDALDLELASDVGGKVSPLRGTNHGERQCVSSVKTAPLS